jgi:hypothetical protein
MEPGAGDFIYVDGAWCAFDRETAEAREGRYAAIRAPQARQVLALVEGTKKDAAADANQLVKA